MAEYKYIIKVGKKIMFEGINLKNNLKEIARKYPKEKISVSWVDLSGDVLIAKI